MTHLPETCQRLADYFGLILSQIKW